MTLSIGQCATLACVLEATAPKPGNVHRGADFEDLTYGDLLTAAVAIGPAMEPAGAPNFVGAVVLQAVRATRAVISTNANLGTILLLAPLAAVPRDESLAAGIESILSGLGPADARDVYEAIRLANPGGLGRVEEADVTIADQLPPSLLEAMQLAADRDLVARQYVNNFEQVLGDSARTLADGFAAGWTAGEAIIHAQLTLMSRFPDSLIARKCGPQAAQESSDRAAAVLEAGTPQEETFWSAAGDFDFWLRSDRHRRNPGTTADLIAAGLFVLLRDGIMQWPLRWRLEA